MANDKKETPVTTYANFQFSLTGKQQAEWQTFLRLMPDAAQNSPVWEMLDDLSYTTSWTESPNNIPWARTPSQAEIRHKEGMWATPDGSPIPPKATAKKAGK